MVKYKQAILILLMVALGVGAANGPDALTRAKALEEQRLEVSEAAFARARVLLAKGQMTKSEEAELFEVLSVVRLADNARSANVLLPHLTFQPVHTFLERDALSHPSKRYPVMDVVVGFGARAKPLILDQLLAERDPKQLRALLLTLSGIIRDELTYRRRPSDARVKQALIEQLRGAAEGLEDEAAKLQIEKVIELLDGK